MIDFESGMMRLQTPNPEPIVKWVVYFQTVDGLFSTLAEAVESAKKREFPPHMIQPVPVALDEQGHYEVCVR